MDHDDGERPEDDAATPKDDAATPKDDAREAHEGGDDPWGAAVPGPEVEGDRLLVPAFLLGLGVGLAVLGLVWLAVATVTDEPGEVANTSNQEPVSEPADDTGSATPSSPPAATTRMERCRGADQAMAKPLEAAGPAMDQWAVHVGAMNKLVVGAITYQQASNFWNRTRLGAQRRIARFRDSVGALGHHGVDCPAPSRLTAASPALRSCARRVEADERVLQAARTGIGTWDRHVHHMDMLRLGTLSPQKATDMWLSMWQQGVRELRSYRLAVRDARQQGDCGEPGTAGTAG